MGVFNVPGRLTDYYHRAANAYRRFEARTALAQSRIPIAASAVTVAGPQPENRPEVIARSPLPEIDISNLTSGTSFSGIRGVTNLAEAYQLNKSYVNTWVHYIPGIALFLGTVGTAIGLVEIFNNEEFLDSALPLGLLVSTLATGAHFFLKSLIPNRHDPDLVTILSRAPTQTAAQILLTFAPDDEVYFLDALRQTDRQHANAIRHEIGLASQLTADEETLE